ncbi:MAG: neutral/alkaline non-lysosomal ceramidase N-terminal domain-containing protein [Cyclobacteriaceae bacterium]|nr:neutral/alkaline non-lysosomal ceramidase N-terminal domain-containing protein [Cyclobacteriaceae bacterium]
MKVMLNRVMPLVLTLLFLSCSKREQASKFQVGASSATVNPATGLFIAGDQPNRKFTGIHDDVFAKAVLLADGDSAIAIVVVDCIGLLYPEVRKIQERAASRIKNFIVLPERIVVTSTHTHSGPDVVGIWGPEQTRTGRDSAYIESLVETAAQQVVEAARKAVPAKGKYAVAEFGMDWVSNISEPAEIDREMVVLQFESQAGEVIATLVNFACHPTIFDGVHDVVSSDYVGGFYTRMRELYGGEHLFLQGAIGGWVQPDKGDRSFEYGFSRGFELAERAKQSLANPTGMAQSNITYRTKIFDFPVTHPGWQQLSDMGVIQRKLSGHTTTQMAWFKVGDVEFATHPGETPPAYSLATKALMKTKGPKIVMGLTFDAMGYILKPSFFDDPAIPHGEYLTHMSTGREAGPTVMKKMDELVP